MTFETFACKVYQEAGFGCDFDWASHGSSHGQLRIVLGATLRRQNCNGLWFRSRTSDAEGLEFRAHGARFEFRVSRTSMKGHLGSGAELVGEVGVYSF